MFKKLFQKKILHNDVQFNPKKETTLRGQFPFFQNNLNVYLDSAASAQKPQVVIDSIVNFYSNEYSNNHGSHNLAFSLNQKIDKVRLKISQFIGAKSPQEVVFTSGATESFNLLASSLNISKDKTNLLVSISEHHSNMLPWQELANKNNLEVRYFNLLASGEIDLEDFNSKLDKHTLLVAVSHCSNVLGVINDVKTICKLANQKNALTIVDATQSIVHSALDVVDLNCDFLAFSGHKLYGPTGIGILYGKFELLNRLKNFKVGGEMVEFVTKEQNYWKETPYRLEAGTANLEGILGLGQAIEWFKMNQAQIFKTEKELFEYLKFEIAQIPRINLIVSENTSENLTKSKHAPILTFTVQEIDSYDLSQYLYLKNIAIRAGQHCTGPLHQFLGVNSTLRVSLACYNTKVEIDLFIQELKNGIKILTKKTPSFSQLLNIKKGGGSIHHTN
jgi:cysteine desulfurase / selenocysteine lyase